MIPIVEEERRGSRRRKFCTISPSQRETRRSPANLYVSLSSRLIHHRHDVWLLMNMGSCGYQRYHSHLPLVHRKGIHFFVEREPSILGRTWFPAHLRRCFVTLGALFVKLRQPSRKRLSTKKEDEESAITIQGNGSQNKQHEDTFMHVLAERVVPLLGLVSNSKPSSTDDGLCASTIIIIRPRQRPRQRNQHG